MEGNVLIAPFDVTGVFGGFVFTANGKRRMALRIGGADYLFKVPRLLRRRVIGNFRSGQVLRLIGVEERDERGFAAKRIVERIVPAEGDGVTFAGPARAGCTVKVCAKKNCWRSGGQELFAALKEEAAALRLADRVALKAVGCLDRCEQAPNVDSPWREYRRCTPHDARAMVAEIAARLGRIPPAPDGDC